MPQKADPYLLGYLISLVKINYLAVRKILDFSTFILEPRYLEILKS